MRNDARIWQWTDTQRSTLTRLWNEDSTLHDIAEAIGCSWRQASDERARLGLEQRPPGWQPRNRERYWVARPDSPRLRNPDATFARAMAGRKFEDKALKPATTTTHTARPLPEADHWASSVTL